VIAILYDFFLNIMMRFNTMMCFNTIWCGAFYILALVLEKLPPLFELDFKLSVAF